MSRPKGCLTVVFSWTRIQHRSMLVHWSLRQKERKAGKDGKRKERELCSDDSQARNSVMRVTFFHFLRSFFSFTSSSLHNSSHPRFFSHLKVSWEEDKSVGWHATVNPAAFVFTVRLFPSQSFVIGQESSPDWLLLHSNAPSSKADWIRGGSCAHAFTRTWVAEGYGKEKKKPIPIWKGAYHTVFRITTCGWETDRSSCLCVTWAVHLPLNLLFPVRVWNVVVLQSAVCVSEAGIRSFLHVNVVYLCRVAESDSLWVWVWAVASMLSIFHLPCIAKRQHLSYNLFPDFRGAH